jgi:hypothetical protein
MAEEKNAFEDQGKQRPVSTSSEDPDQSHSEETRLVQQYLHVLNIMTNVFDSAESTAQASNDPLEVRGQKTIINNEWDSSYAPALKSMQENKDKLSEKYIIMISEKHEDMKRQICATKKRIKDRLKVMCPDDLELHSMLLLESSVLQSVKACDQIITDTRACLDDIRGNAFSINTDEINMQIATNKRNDLVKLTTAIKQTLEKYDHKIREPWLKRLEIKEAQISQIVAQVHEPKTDWKWDHGRGNFTSIPAGNAIYNAEACHCQQHECIICCPPDPDDPFDRRNYDERWQQYDDEQTSQHVQFTDHNDTQQQQGTQQLYPDLATLTITDPTNNAMSTQGGTQATTARKNTRPPFRHSNATTRPRATNRPGKQRSTGQHRPLPQPIAKTNSPVREKY